MIAKNTEESVPLACVRGAISPDQRAAHFQLINKLFREPARPATILDELPNGYEYRFEPEALTDVALFISNERLCCPFLAFHLRVEPNEGSISLRMSGPPGTRAFLEAELHGTSRNGGAGR